MTNQELGPERHDALLELGAATLYEAQQRRGAITAAIKPIDPGMTVAGRVLTVDAGPADNLMLHAALAHAQPGDVLVADARGFLEAGAWGDVLTAAAQQIGVAGLVIDGAVRDAAQIIGMGFPVFARGLSIKGTGKTFRGVIGGTLELSGVTVHNGDVIVGDRDGLVVIAGDEVDDTIAAARAREDKEAEFRRRIADGVSTVELLGLTDTAQRYALL